MAKVNREELLFAIDSCALILKNSFAVIGKSGCIDPKQFDEAIGRDYVREDAINKLWELHSYHAGCTMGVDTDA